MSQNLEALILKSVALESHRQTIVNYQHKQAQFDQKSRAFEENAAESHETVCLLAAKITELQEIKKVLSRLFKLYSMII